MFILSVVLAILLLAPGANAAPLAENGVIDLTQTKFSEHGIRLDGNWDFYWRKFIDPKVHEIADGTLRVPGEWNQFKKDNAAVGGVGFATYRVRVLLGVHHGDGLSIRLANAGTSYKLFANGVLVAANGNPAANKNETVAQFKPGVYPLPVLGDTLDLTLYVANFVDKSGGLWFPLTLGRTEDLRAQRETWIGIEMFLVGAIFIMAIYHFALFYLRRQDLSTLMFGCASLLIALRTSLLGERLLVSVFSNAPFWFFHKLEYLSFYLALPFFYQYFREVFPREFPKTMARFLWVVCGAGTLLVVATPGTIFSHTLLLFNLLTAAIVFHSLLSGMRATLRKQEGSLLFLGGICIFMVAVANDLLYNYEIIDSGYFLPFGLFSFIFFQSFLIGMKFTKAFFRIEELKNELTAQNEKLIQIDKLKDEFLSNTSHELRTPLSGIIGIAESLNAGIAGKLSLSARENIDLIISSGRRLSVLIDDILDFAKIQNSELVLALRPVDLYSASQIIVKLSEPLVASKQINLINEIPKEIDHVLADENRLQQILHNLVGNAVKFTHEGSITLSARKQGQIIEVSVTDTGIGVPQEKHAAIFESFEQADGSISREFGGTGLGLAITKSLVAMQGGTIWVESKEGEGAKFTFTLPIAENISEDIKNPAPRTDRNTPEDRYGISQENKTAVRIADSELPSAPPKQIDEDAKGIQVLAVDDEPINLQVVVNHLELSGIRVATALSAKEAFEKIKTLQPEIVLMDVMMPQMDGYEATSIIRAEFSQGEIPIIILTAKNRTEDMLRSFDSGANDYISKPFDSKELIARVKTLLTLKAALRTQNEFQVLQNELRVAHRIQTSLIPEPPKAPPGLRIASYYQAMAMVGGDFFDFLEAKDKTGIFMADVSGHGVPAALIVSMLKMGFSLMRSIMDQPDELLSQMNAIMQGNMSGNFVTAVYAEISQTGKLSLARAGHPPVLLFRKRTQTLETLMSKGGVLGLQAKRPHEVLSIDLEVGDRLIFYTDGITEAPSPQGELYDDQRLCQFIETHASLDVREFTQALIDDVQQHVGTEIFDHDDIAVVVCDFIGS